MCRDACAAEPETREPTGDRGGRVRVTSIPDGAFDHVAVVPRAGERVPRGPEAVDDVPTARSAAPRLDRVQGVEPNAIVRRVDRAQGRAGIGQRLLTSSPGEQ